MRVQQQKCQLDIQHRTQVKHKHTNNNNNNNTKNDKGSQFKYNVTLRRVRSTIAAVENSKSQTL